MKLKDRFIAAVALVLFGFSGLVFADGEKMIQLQKPDTDGGKPLMQALKERRSSRRFSARPIPPQVLSNLLWAAAGVNRPDSLGRTAPTAMNCQEIDIYAAMQDGLYYYDAFKNCLIQVSADDIRGSTGNQPFVKDAPLNLIFVLNLDKAARMGARAEFYGATDTGFISQNVYLYCASEGLATVVRGLFDEAELSKAMRLEPGRKIILTQSVGYPE